MVDIPSPVEAPEPLRRPPQLEHPPQHVPLDLAAVKHGQARTISTLSSRTAGLPPCRLVEFQ